LTCQRTRWSRRAVRQFNNALKMNKPPSGGFSF
jgi:hypothetical protein